MTEKGSGEESPGTIETVRAALEDAFSLLDRCFELPRDLLERRRGYPGAWTRLEHLEHVSLANRFLLLTIAKGCAKARKRGETVEAPEGESDLEKLSPIASPGAFEWSPPSHMLPGGGREPGEVREELMRQREDCLQLLAGLPAGKGRLCSFNMSVHALGRLDMYQWLYFLAQHAFYHLSFMRGLDG